MSLPIQNVFRFCPRCGVEHPSPGAIPFRCQACAFSMYFGPVAAVGALIVNDANELLVVRRSRDPGKGQWGLPGGFVDPQETVEQALRREVFEEVKLKLDSAALLTTFPNQYDYQGVVSQVIDFYYVARCIDAAAIVLELSELDDFSWVHPANAPLNDMAFDSNRRAIEFWAKSLTSPDETATPGESTLG